MEYTNKPLGKKMYETAGTLKKQCRVLLGFEAGLWLVAGELSLPNPPWASYLTDPATWSTLQWSKRQVKDIPKSINLLRILRKKKYIVLRNWERERERDTERERDRERQRWRETEKDKERDRKRETDRHREKRRWRGRERERGREIKEEKSSVWSVEGWEGKALGPSTGWLL